jgi:fluoride exporter
MGYLLVMAGGAVGAGLRHGVGRLTLATLGPNFPWGTLAVNLIGGLGMGLLVGVLARVGQGGEQWRLLLGVGVLGGFTTFSAFSLDMVNMVQRGAVGLAAGYAAASVAGSMLALWAGLLIVRNA